MESIGSVARGSELVLRKDLRPRQSDWLVRRDSNRASIPLPSKRFPAKSAGIQMCAYGLSTLQRSQGVPPLHFTRQNLERIFYEAFLLTPSLRSLHRMHVSPRLLGRPRLRFKTL